MRPTRRRLLAGAAAAALAPRRGCAAAPIRIGVLTDFSGPYAEDSGEGSVVATKLAVEDARKRHPELAVEIVSADFQNKPDVASAIAAAWYDREGVDLVIDVPVSNAALAVASVARQRNKVAIFNPGTSELTGRACSPNHIHWCFDTYGLAASTAQALLAAGADTWFFVQADYAFGTALAGDAGGIVIAGGGRVLGAVKHPFPGTTDFSSYLLAAQASGARVVALANAGTDAGNCIKQASEFGIARSGQKLAALLCLIPQIRSIGLEVSQGLVLSEAFYWDLNDGTRAFSARFALQVKDARPCSIQAGCYSGTLHFLKAVASLGPAVAKADGAAVVARMKAMPTDDPLFGQGVVREDGRKLHDMHLFQVKAPGDSRGPWDLYRLLRSTPGGQAYRPLALGGCPLVRS
jgi:branched-chain amino acid transport system substrate-binding protein